ncbi:unnamed protein product [Vitrella brassicaformis CCMP3155]|uniref:TLDc domain-containing protein n=2 Tax=Vitrella brassicaformis TaxID=1169539 RepID=A0A0G4FVY9_VITBC|nr:unnamed protein product [Vitrella brassicaformis CCMP3155]|eukprot:CEM19077.1 unnamed protein product [Vitrella brassicaformis CCMP3155]
MYTFMSIEDLATASGSTTVGPDGEATPGERRLRENSRFEALQMEAALRQEVDGMKALLQQQAQELAALRGAKRALEQQLQSDISAVCEKLEALQLAFDQHKEDLQQMHATSREAAQEIKSLQGALGTTIREMRGMVAQVQGLRAHVVDDVTTAVQVDLHDDKRGLRQMAASLDAIMDNLTSDQSVKLVAAARHICTPGQQFVRLSSHYGSYRALRHWLSRYMRIKSMQLLYKSSRDGFKYSTFLSKTLGAQRLLFLIRDGPAHLFACTMDHPLAQPDSPTQAKETPCPVSFYSISGACGGPTKIPMPAELSQGVAVAGREGAVRGPDGQPVADMAIGVDDAAVMVLGRDESGPAADLSGCAMMVKKAYLPIGYRGEVDEDGDGTLAGSMTFAITEMEVWLLAS